MHTSEWCMPGGGEGARRTSITTATDSASLRRGFQQLIANIRIFIGASTLKRTEKERDLRACRTTRSSAPSVIAMLAPRRFLLTKR